MGRSKAKAKKQLALGIPDKEKSSKLPFRDKPELWEFVIQDHHARRRGPHYDLRLGDPKSKTGYSWALTAHTLPGPEESVFAIKQPDHDLAYFDYEGKLPPGYGEGEVKKAKRSKAEVFQAKPNHIEFGIYDSSTPEEYSLHQINEDVWRLLNKTPTREKYPELPKEKKKYREASPESVDLDDPDVVFSPKIDGAHSVLHFSKAHEPVRVYSYREAKRSPTKLIEHTHKIPGLQEHFPVASGLGGTILRGEAYEVDKDAGEALSAQETAAVLNSNVFTSREKQREKGPLRIALFDVDRYKGRDVTNLPYQEKLKILEEIDSQTPASVHIPQVVSSKKEKTELLEKIHSGKHPQTKEGVVAVSMSKPRATPTKVKSRPDYDVYVREILPGGGKFRNRGASGFTYSDTPKGKVKGRVGTGFSDKQREHMYQNPEAYQGAVVRVGGHGRFGPSGAIKAPSFMGAHPDKNPPEKLQKILEKSASRELAQWLKAAFRRRDF